GLDPPRLDTARREMSRERGLVEANKAQAEMLEIAPLLARRTATPPAQLAGNIHEIDQRLAGAKLHQSILFKASLLAAAEGTAIKAQGLVQIAHAQDNMIEAPNGERVGRDHDSSSRCRTN